MVPIEFVFLVLLAGGMLGVYTIFRFNGFN